MACGSVSEGWRVGVSVKGWGGSVSEGVVGRDMHQLSLSSLILYTKTDLRQNIRSEETVP